MINKERNISWQILKEEEIVEERANVEAMTEENLTEEQEIEEKFFPKKAGKPDKKQLEALGAMLNSCYVCDRVEADMHHLMATVFVEWAKGGEFRQTFRDQPFICLNHYRFIMNAAMGKRGVPSKQLADFHADVLDLVKGYLDSLKKDVSHFVDMFDYRSKGQEWGTSVDAIERSIEFLTKEKPYAIAK